LAGTHRQALWFRDFGNPLDVLRLEDAPLPPLENNRIRVRMRVAPINPSDLIPVTGGYAHRVLPPLVCGYEGVGMVIEGVGEGRSQNGRRVLPLRGQGTWQTHVDCDPAWAVPVPDDIDDALAARAYINPLAAFLMLDRHDVRGKHVVLTAPASTCAGLLGAWALDRGARTVTGIYRSHGAVDAPQAIGMEAVPDTDAAAIDMAARRADIVFDAVGGPLASSILKSMPPSANFVSYGLLSGISAEIPPAGPHPQRFHIRDHLEGLAPEIWHGWFARLWPLLRKSRMPDTALFPLTDWRPALQNFAIAGRRFKPMFDLR
jgi:NADPH:quinone reductase-like Zn-dependent oxidoreductase